MKKYIIFIYVSLLFIFLFLACTRKETLSLDTKYTKEQITYSINSSLYIIPPDGLNLRSESSTAGARIRLLPQNTKVTVLGISENTETIDELIDFWYKVDTGEEIGWVFGGYLSLYPIEINSNGKKIPKFIYDFEIKKYNNGLIFNVVGAIEYNNRDKIYIYESNTKDSSKYITDHNRIFLFKILETPDWFYSITDKAEALGYIYLYDISEKSFYSDFEANMKSGNRYIKSLNNEYILIKQYQNINRSGPLLRINHNNKNIDFWNTFNGKNGALYQILNYYPEHNEILIIEQYYEGENVFIYNLETEEKKCENLSYHHLYFNESRTYLFSLDWIYGGAMFPEVKIFKINNGIYKKIYDDQIYGLYSNSIINSISWINNYEISINCSTGIVKILLDDISVEIINNLENSTTGHINKP